VAVAPRTLGTASAELAGFPINIGVAALIVSAPNFGRAVGGAGRVDRPLLDKIDKPFVQPFQNIGR
jgi:hypothetical protein